MKTSESRILTTHTGSLPRTSGVLDALQQRDRRAEVDEQSFAASAGAAVTEVVNRQVDTGLDVINDGEQSKPSYATYVKDRLTGFEGESVMPTVIRLDEADFPQWAERYSQRGSNTAARPACTGPIAWKDWSAVEQDVDRLKAATEGKNVAEVFMTAASPGVIANFLTNRHYPTDEAYLYALADVMKDEYTAIVEAGFLLQVDCPDLAMTRNSQFSHLTVEEFKKVAEMHVEALNYAVAGLPPDRMRMHLCWGNYEGPHNHDVPLREIAPIALKARPLGLSFEGANPRHEHEWRVWQDVNLPEGKVIIPGVLDTTTNFIEHPELVAERIARYASVVGRERVIAGADCGFGTFLLSRRVDAGIAWAKLASLVEGARLASESLW